jgi:hypothetical protein
LQNVKFSTTTCPNFKCSNEQLFEWAKFGNVNCSDYQLFELLIFECTIFLNKNLIVKHYIVSSSYSD